MDFSLEPIFEYEMTPLQAKAYKLALQWLVLSKKHFPNYKHSKGFPKKGDPRKCMLFQYCYKCIRETQGLIPDDEYKLYIKAQLDVLKAIDLGGSHPAIEPNCLAGDKAWIRWKLWKRKYDQIVKRASSKEDVGLDVTPVADVIKELKSTKAYLEGRFDGTPKEEQIMMAGRDMERWIALGKVSGFYAACSPWVKKHCKTLTVDLSLYKITPEIQKAFSEHFGHEA